MEVSRITIRGMDIEEREGEIYIDGKHIDTGQYHSMWLTSMFFIGFGTGVSTLGFVLLLVEYLLKYN